MEVAPMTRYLITILVVLLGSSIVHSPGEAAPIACPIGLTPFAIQDTADTGWTMCYNAGQVTNPSFTGDARGTLSFTKTFTTNAAIDILFLQNAEPALPPDGDNTEGGLRIKVTETVRNRTTSTWADFEEVLTDLAPICADPANDKNVRCVTKTDGNVGNGSHPQFPHFHTVTAEFDPFTTISEASEAGMQMRLTGGLVGPGQDITTTSPFILHTPDAGGIQRS